MLSLPQPSSNHPASLEKLPSLQVNCRLIFRPLSLGISRAIIKVLPVVGEQVHFSVPFKTGKTLFPQSRSFLKTLDANGHVALIDSLGLAVTFLRKSKSAPMFLTRSTTNSPDLPSAADKSSRTATFSLNDNPRTSQKYSSASHKYSLAQAHPSRKSIVLSSQGDPNTSNELGNTSSTRGLVSRSKSKICRMESIFNFNPSSRFASLAPYMMPWRG